MRISIAAQTPWSKLSTLDRVSIVYILFSRTLSIYPVFSLPGAFPIFQTLSILDIKQHPQSLSAFEIWHVVLDIIWIPFGSLVVGGFFRVQAAYRMQSELDVLKEGWQPRARSM
jgi:hypothetical protein